MLRTIIYYRCSGSRAKIVAHPCSKPGYDRNNTSSTKTKFNLTRTLLKSFVAIKDSPKQCSKLNLWTFTIDITARRSSTVEVYLSHFYGQKWYDLNCFFLCYSFITLSNIALRWKKSPTESFFCNWDVQKMFKNKLKGFHHVFNQTRIFFSKTKIRCFTKAQRLAVNKWQ